ncbi:MAG: hypothetical protein IPL79_00170 [Myxococcales bacterium]|nr:hypothetical protein [Myxococcales bacterium]
MNDVSSPLAPHWLALGVLCAAMLGCGKASDENQAKRTSKPPPQETERKPFGIAVLAGEREVLTITNALLDQRAPDFKDEDRRAWKLATLLPGVVAGTTVTAFDAQGIHLSFDWPVADPALHPVLMVSRRGNVAVTMINDNEPFPEFHGQGNRLERRGDLRPRLQPVSKLVITQRGPGQTTPPATMPPPASSAPTP